MRSKKNNLERQPENNLYGLLGYQNTSSWQPLAMKLAYADAGNRVCRSHFESAPSWPVLCNLLMFCIERSEVFYPFDASSKILRTMVFGFGI